MLGIALTHDAKGFLQDVHESEGQVCYFTSYLLGHLVSAQLSEAMTKSIGAPEDHVREGSLDAMLDWLRQNVHTVGRALNAEQLVEKVSGRKLCAKPFLDYLEAKVNNLR